LTACLIQVCLFKEEFAKTIKKDAKYFTPGFQSTCQKYVSIDLAKLSKVIASQAKQSLRSSKR
jgi:hypothetical protein